MKIWSVKITHENWNWMKNWLNMDSTLGIFSKTNSSSWLRIFYHLSSNSFSRSSGVFSKLNNQNSTSIKIQKKMEEFGEKMKTHVSKISLGSLALVWPSGKIKSHNGFRRCKTQKIKMGFSSWILLIESFPYLFLDLRLDEQKPR